MMGKIEVALYQPHALDFWHLVIFREIEGAIMVFVPIATEHGVVWNWEEYPEGEVPPPSLMIPRTMTMQGVMVQLASALKSNGFEAPGRDSDEKELRATQAHLGDMQKIVFEFDSVKLRRDIPFVSEEEPNA